MIPPHKSSMDAATERLAKQAVILMFPVPATTILFSLSPRRFVVSSLTICLKMMR